MRLSHLPILKWRSEWQVPGVLRADLFAGATNAVVVLPQGLAFSTLAGMPPQYGLYAAMVPCLIAALFGSSRLMVTGPANAISLMTLALLAPLATPGSAQYISFAITLTFLVGVMQLAFSAARLGRFADQVPHSVVVGFTAGAAVLIANSQVGPILGLSLLRGQGVIANITQAWQQISQTQISSVLIAALTILIIRLWRPWNNKIPGMLVSVVVATAAASAANYFINTNYAPGSIELSVASGLSAIGWQAPPTVGVIPSVLPVFAVPNLSFDQIQTLLVVAAVMTLLALTEAMAIARSMALQNGDTLDSNQEIRAQGLANVAGSFFSSYPASGSFNRSAVNAQSGARTPLSAVFAALILVLILAVFVDWIRFIPYAAIAGLLMMVAIGLFNIKELRHEFSKGPREYIPMLVTFIGTLVFSLEWAIVLGLACAFLVRKFIKP
jgi:SulP family sulfate permease